MTPLQIQGTYHPSFERLKDAFVTLMNGPYERGGALCVRIDDETVVDLWGGVAGTEPHHTWQQNTLLNLFSCTKTFTAVAILQLVGEGRLELDTPVCHYWPEFAQHGKQEVTVRHVLCHRAGLPALRTPLSQDDIYDWDAMVARVAAEAPWSAPGERQTYSPLVYGWILGELLRRVDGRSAADSIQCRVAQPLGLDFHLGLDDTTRARCAFMARTKEKIDDDAFARVLDCILTHPDAMSALAFSNPPFVLGRSNDAAWKRMVQPAANGHGNARSLAGFYAGLLSGALLDPALLKEMVQEQSSETDPTLLTPARFGLGIMLDQPDVPNGSYGLGPNTFGHLGAGGTIGFADPDRAMSVGFACNTIGSYVLMDPRPQQLAKVAMSCL